MDKIYKQINVMEETLNKILHSIKHQDKSSFFIQSNEQEREKKIRSFMEMRIARLMNEEIPVKLGTNAKVILHLIPSSAFDQKNEKRLDIKEFHQEMYRLSPLGEGGHNHNYNRRYNYDGFLTYNKSGYAQTFRNGCIEAISQHCFDINNKILHITKFESSVVRGVSDYVKVLNGIGVSNPMEVYITLRGVNNYSFKHSIDDNNYRIDREEIILPPIKIDKLENLPLSMKGSFDILWNAGGFSESINYKSGNWEPKY